MAEVSDTVHWSVVIGVAVPWSQMSVEVVVPWAWRGRGCAALCVLHIAGSRTASGRFLLTRLSMRPVVARFTFLVLWEIVSTWGCTVCSYGRLLYIMRETLLFVCTFSVSSDLRTLTAVRMFLVTSVAGWAWVDTPSSVAARLRVNVMLKVLVTPAFRSGLRLVVVQVLLKFSICLCAGWTLGALATNVTC